MSRKFIELAVADIGETRKVIISKNNAEGGLTIAQQIIAVENGSKTLIYLKGAIHVSDIEALYNLRDALNEAIDKEEAHNIANEVKPFRNITK